MPAFAFFNPVPLMKLLEIIKHEEISNETVEITKNIANSMNKTAIIVKDSPGFATSRLGVVLGNEAIRMLAEGVASASDIDYAMKIEFGEGQGFDIGAGYTKKLFPNTPTSAQTLRSSKNNRRAVNKATGKGAMMRRGATKAMQRFERSGLSQVPEKYNLDAKLKMAMNVK